MSQTSKNLIYGLHGFLGDGLDWKPVFNQLASEYNEFITPSLFQADQYDSIDLDQIFSNIKEIKNFKSYKRRVFVGYSMGGRIGLNLLKKQPDLFDHYILISTHPGLQDEKNKLDRIESDSKWAEILRQEPWNQFLNKWNNQEVLKSENHPQRLEKDYSVQKLIQALTNWSLGQQEDFRAILKENSNQITWVVGEQDVKFLNIAQDLEQKKTLLGFKRVFANHRIIFENPKSISDIIKKITE